jgi:hypothetical protein
MMYTKWKLLGMHTWLYQAFHKEMVSVEMKTWQD